MVVMKGLAMTAGSSLSLSASIGSVQPTIFAQQTVSSIVTHTTAATRTVTASLPISRRSTSMILQKVAAARVAPQSTATRISFQMTWSRSENSTSPRDRLRMTVTLAWEPEFPPVSISIGMKTVSTTCTASASSKLVRIMPVKVAETIRSSSQGMRFFQISKTPVFIYGRSEGVMAAMISMSSVASCSMTSMTSSTVTMPTRRFSLSTTGMASRL